jgi:hypothetical protein
MLARDAKSAPKTKKGKVGRRASRLRAKPSVARHRAADLKIIVCPADSCGADQLALQLPNQRFPYSQATILKILYCEHETNAANVLNHHESRTNNPPATTQQD